jgi:opacity protein-like surface antigen
MLISTDPGDDEQSSHYGYIRFGHALTRNLALRLGYGQTQYEYRTDDPAVEEADRRIRSHNIDAGIDYNRTLSFSRRTTLAFNTGSIVVTDGDESLFSLVGGATLAHEIGRTWGASLDYRRSVGFLEVFNSPTLIDNATFSLGGLIGRRLRFSSNVGASRGSVGFFRGDGTAYSTYRGGASLSMALTRLFALRGDYTYSQYRFDEPAAVPDVLATGHVRYHSVRVGLDVWTPIWTRARRP